MVVEEMMNERRILVAVDESEESMLALSWCLRRVPIFWRCRSHEKISKDLAMSVMRRAQPICNKFNSNIKVEKKVGSGDAKEVICSAVEKLKADILVIGCHKDGFLQRTLGGSVSDYCSKHVKWPTVVGNQPKNEKILNAKVKPSPLAVDIIRAAGRS